MAAMVEIYRRSEKVKKRAKSKNLDPRKEVYRLIGKPGNFLSAFVPQPKKAYFETQGNDEEIILLLRKHWVTNIPWVLMLLVMVFAPLVLTNFPLIEFLPARFQFIVVLMWYLLTFAFVLEKFLSWYFNVYIITDERIIDIDFYNLIYKKISDADIENIEDVTLVMGGALQTIFNFGDVKIQTAGEVPEFEFEQAPKPSVIINVLQQLRTEEKIEAIEGRVR